jgi:hypothetical protein
LELSRIGFAINDFFMTTGGEERFSGAKALLTRSHVKASRTPAGSG